MKFLRQLIEDSTSLFRFTVEVYNRNDEKVDEVTVVATTSQEAEAEAVQRSKHSEAISGLAIGKEDIE